MNSFRFLGMSVMVNMLHHRGIKQAEQRLYFLGTLKKEKFQTQILGSFYRGAIESLALAVPQTPFNCERYQPTQNLNQYFLSAISTLHSPQSAAGKA